MPMSLRHTVEAMLDLQTTCLSDRPREWVTLSHGWIWLQLLQKTRVWWLTGLMMGFQSVPVCVREAQSVSLVLHWLTAHKLNGHTFVLNGFLNLCHSTSCIGVITFNCCDCRRGMKVMANQAGFLLQTSDQATKICFLQGGKTIHYLGTVNRVREKINVPHLCIDWKFPACYSEARLNTGGHIPPSYNQIKFLMLALSVWSSHCISHWCSSFCHFHKTTETGGWQSQNCFFFFFSNYGTLWVLLKTDQVATHTVEWSQSDCGLLANRSQPWVSTR